MLFQAVRRLERLFELVSADRNDLQLGAVNLSLDVGSAVGDETDGGSAVEAVRHVAL